jgi:hypothetical protein
MQKTIRMLRMHIYAEYVLSHDLCVPLLYSLTAGVQNPVLTLLALTSLEQKPECTHVFTHSLRQDGWMW